MQKQWPSTYRKKTLNYNKSISHSVSAADVKHLFSSLLKNAASFRPNPLDAAAEHPEAPVKRCSYVRCIIQLICRSSYLKDVRSEALGIILNNLMTEVEGIVASS